MEILLRNAQRKYKVHSPGLKKNAKIILEQLGCHDSELSILLVSDAKIRQLNHQYRDLDVATDVLSFPQNEDGAGEFDSHLLGDVVISVETAHRQAGEHQLILEEELVLLLIHGILHLLGYDHERSPREERVMKQKTGELFQLIFPGRKPSSDCNY